MQLRNAPLELPEPPRPAFRNRPPCTHATLISQSHRRGSNATCFPRKVSSLDASAAPFHKKNGTAQAVLSVPQSTESPLSADNIRGDNRNSGRQPDANAFRLIMTNKYMAPIGNSWRGPAGNLQRRRSAAAEACKTVLKKPETQPPGQCQKHCFEACKTDFRALSGTFGQRPLST
jgi:hypothetical protein